VLCWCCVFISCKGKDKSEAGSGNITARTGDLDALKSSESPTIPEFNAETSGSPVPDVSGTVFTLKEEDTLTVGNVKLDDGSANVTTVFGSGTIEKPVGLEIIPKKDDQAKSFHKKLTTIDTSKGKCFGEICGEDLYAFVYESYFGVYALNLVLATNTNKLFKWNNKRVVLTLLCSKKRSRDRPSYRSVKTKKGDHYILRN
jgi:hypothetical protein